MCWHSYKYIGLVDAYRWFLGVSGGIPIATKIKAKQCQKCGKIQEV